MWPFQCLNDDDDEYDDDNDSSYVISTNLEHVIKSKVLKCIFNRILVRMYQCIYMYTYMPPFGTFSLFLL